MTAHTPTPPAFIENMIEAAFWEMDARIKGYNQWKCCPQSSRDAFKWVVRAMVADAMAEQERRDGLLRDALNAIALKAELCAEPVTGSRTFIAETARAALAKVGDALAKVQA